jgi:hypothetical protein
VIVLELAFEAGGFVLGVLVDAALEVFDSAARQHRAAERRRGGAALRYVG